MKKIIAIFVMVLIISACGDMKMDRKVETDIELK